MKHISYLYLMLLLALGLSACGGDDDEETPQPTSVTFNLTSATKDGNAISPLPTYVVTFNFTAEGEPNGYTVSSNTATFSPTLGNSGTFQVTGQQVTFSTGGASRIVTISGGSISSTSTTVSLQWELTKLDDGVTAQEQGVYVFTLTTQ